MPSILDRLNRELEAMGRRAQDALDEGRIQIELLRTRRKRDTLARDLGTLVHRQSRGGLVEAQALEDLMTRLDIVQADIARLERELAAERGETVSVDDQPAAAEAAAEPAAQEEPKPEPPAAS